MQSYAGDLTSFDKKKNLTLFFCIQSKKSTFDKNQTHRKIVRYHKIEDGSQR